MATDFGQVVGGILNAIAEARSISDARSRALAEVYERDPLLRVFPVPRVEVGSAEIELRFAMAHPDSDASNPRSHRVADLIGETTGRVREAVLGALHGGPLSQLVEVRRRLFRPGLDGFGERIEAAVRQVIAQPTQLALSLYPDENVQLESFHVTRCAEQLLAMLRESATLKGGESALQAALEELLKPLQADHEEAVRHLRTQVPPEPLGVIFTHNELAGLPQHALATIKISLNIRNYSWVDIANEKTADGRQRRTLVRD